MVTLSATVCQVQEAHSTVKERNVLCATPVGRRELAEKRELDIESLAMSVERKSCANMKERRDEHAQDVARKAVDKPLWKHIVDKHNGVMERPTFSQFKMDVTQFFKSAQRRKANEGVRIASLDPATRMNSCNEFRQGTNIMMRPVRGVGV